MGYTIIEKIIKNNIHKEHVQPGNIETVKVDRVMIHDIFIPFVAEKFSEMGFTDIWDKDKVVLIYDHLVPTSVVEDVRHFQIGDAFASTHNLSHVHRSDGICHQLMVEKGYAKPGNIVFGTDSHTTTYGGVGCFSSGIGYTEMASILGTGEMWLRVPESIKVIVDGKLPDGVMSKDIILKLLGDLKSDGATYKSIEFTGTTINDMSVSSRLTIANMAVEAGAKCCIFQPDKKTCDFMGIELNSVNWIYADDDAKYSKVLRYNAEELVPLCACPSKVDNIKPVEELEGTSIDQVFIGSCTNGRLEDLATAAHILKGENVKCKLIITPASRKIYMDAIEAGYIDTLARAGAIITHPACGLCCGRAGGILADDEVVLATNNRNFLGRMGSSKVKIYLSSPATAAYSAIEGKISLSNK